MTVRLWLSLQSCTSPSCVSLNLGPWAQQAAAAAAGGGNAAGEPSGEPGLSALVPARAEQSLLSLDVESTDA